MRSRLVVVIVVACVGSAVATPAVAGGTWQVEPTPATTPVNLSFVSCPVARFCMAAGYHVVYAWHGKSWSALPTPANLDYMVQVACPTRTACIGVGTALDANSEPQTAAWSWNGTKWTDLLTLIPKSAVTSNLDAITCARTSSCEAVGSYGTGSNTYPLAEYWNGKQWRRQSTHGAPAGAELGGVSCEAPGVCEAVGFNGNSSTAFAMGLSGSKWVTQTTADIYPSAFTAVSCFSTGCTAVGSIGGGELLAEFWNGSTWSVQGLGSGSPPNPSQLEWNGVHCESASNCMAVGFWGNAANDGEPQTLVDTWNGSSWIAESTPDPSPYGDLLNQLSCTSSGSVCMVVGDQETVNGTWSALAMRN
jgi:hypothetical protein